MLKIVSKLIFMLIGCSILSFAQSPEKFDYDFGFIIENAPASGNIDFSNLKNGIVFLVII